VAWSLDLYDTQSGDLLAPLSAVSGTWGRGDQTLRQTTVQLHEKFSKAKWHEMLEAWWDRQLVHSWNGEPVYAGTLLAAPAFNRRTRALTLQHADLSLILDRRWLHGVGTSRGEGGYQKTGGFEVSGVSLQGAIVKLLEVLYRAPISPAWPVPVDLPAAGAGSFAKRWDFYNFANGEEIIRGISELDGGPQLDLQPKIVGGKLRWDQRIGNPLTGPAFDVHLDARVSAAESSSIGYLGQETATGIHYPGKGSEEDMRVGAAFLPPSAGLARDSIFWDKDEEDVDRLITGAKGRLNGLTDATVRRPLTLKAAMISPADLRIGSLLTIHSDCKVWEPAVQVCRVVGFSGPLGGQTYDVELQEVSRTL
jgi:hypothetical protein